MISVHLESGRCRVACSFCYLGTRSELSGSSDPIALSSWLTEALAGLSFAELAVAVSEPVDEVTIKAVRELATLARRVGARLTVTTTLSAARRHGVELRAKGVDRFNLSLDPQKGATSREDVREVADRLGAGPGASEMILVPTLESSDYARRLIEGGLLADLLEIEAVSGIVLNAPKPPPPWCDRAFWLRTAATLAPLLDRWLDRRLFLDCWVAARIFGLGDCPTRPDFAPSGTGVAYRSCVYQPTPDAVLDDPRSAGARLLELAPLVACPFAYG